MFPKILSTISVWFTFKTIKSIILHSTHLFNCQFKCSNQVPKQKEFLRSGLWRACTNRVWLLAFFVERAWMAGRALTSSKIYSTFIIHLFQATCHAFFLSHMFFSFFIGCHTPQVYLPTHAHRWSRAKIQTRKIYLDGSGVADSIWTLLRSFSLTKRKCMKLAYKLTYHLRKVVMFY